VVIAPREVVTCPLELVNQPESLVADCAHGVGWCHLTRGMPLVGASSCVDGSVGVVRANLITLPARPIHISPPLIFLDFSGSIWAAARPSQVFGILLVL
jgi:hypothetical protein